MKIDEKKMKERFVDVPKQHQVFIYDGTVLLKFLEETFELPQKILFISEMQPYLPFKKIHFKNPQHYKAFAKPAGEVYEMYRMWRRTKDYTTPLESYYTFRVMLGKLRFPKNNWQFTTFRWGKDQTVFFSPFIPKGTELRLE